MNLSKRQIIKLTMFIIVSTVYIVGFVLNITYDGAMYNVDQNYVPLWQNSVSQGFITWMNVISYCMNPVFCAGYITLIWIFSNKKMEILIFINYFVFIIWAVVIIKSCIQQPRPFWIQGSEIRMLSWDCQTQYGSPSGHSTSSLIFLQFLARLTVKSFNSTKKIIWLLYFLMASIQVLVMFSRVILGVHSLNEVLFGAMSSIYAIVAYYTYIQTLMLRYFMILATTKRRAFQFMIIIIFMLLVWALEIMLFLLPTYNNDTFYLDSITAHPGCGHPKIYDCFQYKCLVETALLMVVFGTLIALNFMKNPQIFTKSLNYSIISWKFIVRYIIWGVAAVIPVGIFYLNKAWGLIDADNIGKAFIKWSTQSVGFFFPPIMVFFVAIPICKMLNLQTYGECQYSQAIKIRLTEQRSKNGPIIQLRDSQYKA